jgi:hypothetical protein
MRHPAGWHRWIRLGLLLAGWLMVAMAVLTAKLPAGSPNFALVGLLAISAFLAAEFATFRGE